MDEDTSQQRLSTVSFLQPLELDLDAAMLLTDIGSLELVFWILFLGGSSSISWNHVDTGAYKPQLAQTLSQMSCPEHI